MHRFKLHIGKYDLSMNADGNLFIKNYKLSLSFIANLYNNPFTRETIIRNIRDFTHLNIFSNYYDNGILEADYQYTYQKLLPCIKKSNKIYDFFIYNYGL